MFETTAPRHLILNLPLTRTPKSAAQPPKERGLQAAETCAGSRTFGRTVSCLACCGLKAALQWRIRCSRRGPFRSSGLSVRAGVSLGGRRGLLRLVPLSAGARALARYTVPRCRAQACPCPLGVFTLKRRERRAPPARGGGVCHSVAPASIRSGLGLGDGSRAVRTREFQISNLKSQIS